MAPAAPAVPAAPAAPASVPEARVLSIAELPPELRRELPTLVVSGSVYSELPSARFVILNGQLTHEGEKLGQELVLEQIQLRSAVLRYKGTRFRIAY
jgi:general secretion pathway protein B